MKKHGKKSFLEKLTSSINIAEEEEDTEELAEGEDGEEKNWMEEDNEEGQLMVDVHQTANDIIIQTMVAGVDPDDLDITITRDMVTIRGTRKKQSHVSDDNYFYKELYWGSFSRTILLPQEIDPDGAEAIEKNGLLTLRLPKIDKEKKKHVRVKTA